jgi:histidinol-phosphate/aromatic aminotransferase/cobyric acid decarboxylase-like protein
MAITNNALHDKFLRLKSNAGTHSPSITSIKTELPELEIKVDACFLSNPYATELFLKYFKSELIDTGEINRVLEFYPSQNKEISLLVGAHLGIDPSRIFIANGATEIVQAIMHNFVKEKLLINIPTFSPYYEFALPHTEVVFYNLKKEENFRLDPDHYISFVRETKPDTIVLINPNNPDGGYLPHSEMIRVIKELSWVPNIVIDESFIHFAFENSSLELPSIVSLMDEFPNLHIIKSMSKDFGIAGIRCGYAIMPPQKVAQLLKTGYLWNSGGLAEYFFRLYTRKDFIKEYEEVRKKYITESLFFVTELNQIPKIKVYPTKANFVLIEILNGKTSDEISTELLLNYGIYVRNCSDKVGLEDGHFIRVATRYKAENEYIVKSLRSIFH